MALQRSKADGALNPIRPSPCLKARKLKDQTAPRQAHDSEGFHEVLWLIWCTTCGLPVDLWRICNLHVRASIALFGIQFVALPTVATLLFNGLDSADRPELCRRAATWRR